MRVNVCVNGTFRYPDYIRFYEQAGILNRFYFAHRRSQTPAVLGLPTERTHNLWLKQYLMAAAFRSAPDCLSAPLSRALCDRFQQGVLKRWQPCDSLEAVIGAVADHVIAFARREGTKVLGHPVTTQCATVRRLVDQARADLGLAPDRTMLAEAARRGDEVAACDALVVDSGFVARSFVAAGVPAERISVVRPGFDPVRFHPRDLSEVDRETFLVVCVGIVTPRKAQHVLLRAWRMLNLPKAKLVLVGALGRDARAVIRGHEGTFSHIPHVPHGALRSLLARASCFVLSSAEDGFAQAPLEAMACGVPTILSETVGAAELIEHGRTGFVVPTFDPEAIAAVLERLYRDRTLGESVGHAASVARRDAGTWPDYAGQVIALHRRLTGDTSTSARAAA
ncbi:glycosyltransferase family 4 protein [Lichenifustis flavocetrariae]|uniref:Glycosyltransferase family 4 protein n=1 Tax=Lichenifustis flavocetrariae TaxID=2949735 RepID=A0AA41YR13_9HYPH|nr:glycosyltransferase family 4 protein [Lichenifustis flavocetrariae]MCW6506564.1 glycosyltransferase family 4 protein [Lichenifustis flavocetrariae]